MTMPGRADRDARGKVEIAVAVNIPDVTAGGALRDKRVGLGCGGCDVAVAPFQEGPGSRTGRNGPDVQYRHGLPRIYTLTLLLKRGEGKFSRAVNLHWSSLCCKRERKSMPSRCARLKTWR